MPSGGSPCNAALALVDAMFVTNADTTSVGGGGGGGLAYLPMGAGLGLGGGSGDGDIIASPLSSELSGDGTVPQPASATGAPLASGTAAYAEPYAMGCTCAATPPRASSAAWRSSYNAAAIGEVFGNGTQVRVEAAAVVIRSVSRVYTARGIR